MKRDLRDAQDALDVLKNNQHSGKMTKAIYLEIKRKAKTAHKAKHRVSVSRMLKYLGSKSPQCAQACFSNPNLKHCSFSLYSILKNPPNLAVTSSGPMEPFQCLHVQHILFHLLTIFYVGLLFIVCISFFYLYRLFYHSFSHITMIMLNYFT